MWIAVINNLPQMILGTAWSGLCLYAGFRAGAWKARRKPAA
jgi:hypothetical protein